MLYGIKHEIVYGIKYEMLHGTKFKMLFGIKYEFKLNVHVALQNMGDKIRGPVCTQCDVKTPSTAEHHRDQAKQVTVLAEL